MNADTHSIALEFKRQFMALVYLEPVHPRTSKSDVLSLLQESGRIMRAKIGKIEIHAGQAVVDIPEEWAERLVRNLRGAKLHGQSLRAWTGAANSADSETDDHFAHLLRLLELESQAEATQVRERLQRLSPKEAEQMGNSLVELVVDDEYTGLGGRFLLTFVKRNRELGLPWTRLGTGSPVIVSPAEDSGGPGYRGVVSERNEREIVVALNDLPEDTSGMWRVDLSSDEVARQRQRTALEQVRSSTPRERLGELRAIATGERDPQFKPVEPLVPLVDSLNESQQAAVAFALAADDVAIVHGPPGTGKTTTVVEFIRQAVARGERVLACAPSNLAVDNLLERLLWGGERAVRLGHPARVLPQLREHTLDLMIEEHKDIQIARKLVREALILRRKASRYTRAKPPPGAKQEMRQEARELFADARRLEQQTVERILDDATVLCCTTTGVRAEVLGNREFDWAVIDEAGQSTEPPCWIPLLRCRRVLLAGDHFQLPPTVLSNEATAQGFSVSLLERLVELHGAGVSRLLQVQYRMHESIMGFSSREFYGGRLEADASVVSHVLADLPDVVASPLTETPVEFIDTAGAGYDEEVEPDGESRLNPDEARLVCRKVHALLEAGLARDQVAVIAPYAAHVRYIREELQLPGVEVDTVDGFQGREKEAVIVSLVRSNATGEIGFLADTRRMNVALTRARRKLLVIGDSATLSNDPFYHRMFDYFESIGAYHTVWEEDMS